MITSVGSPFSKVALYPAEAGSAVLFGMAFRNRTPKKNTGCAVRASTEREPPIA